MPSPYFPEAEQGRLYGPPFRRAGRCRRAGPPWLAVDAEGACLAVCDTAQLLVAVLEPAALRGLPEFADVRVTCVLAPDAAWAVRAGAPFGALLLALPLGRRRAALPFLALGPAGERQGRAHGAHSGARKRRSVSERGSSPAPAGEAFGA